MNHSTRRFPSSSGTIGLLVLLSWTLGLTN
jgi:hypothetical protein